MKIKAVKMKHFGRFTDKELEFGDGLNIIEGDNEAGKSTVHAFIRGMLFGIEKQRGRAGKNDVYSRYLPWDTPGAYQGSLDIEHEGRNIRISRVFLQNAKSCTAQDTDTGENIEMSDGGITAIVDRLTPSAFDNTVSCAQQQLKSKDDFGSYIRSYIANMADSRDSGVDVSSALELLDDRIRDIGRKLKDTDEAAAQEAYESLLEDEKDESIIIADRDEAKEIIASLENEKHMLERETDPAALRRKHDLMDKLADRLKRSDAERNEAERYRVRAAEYIKKLEDCESRLSAGKRELDAVSEREKGIEAELEAASSGENDPEKTAKEAGEAAEKAAECDRTAQELKTQQENIIQKAKKLMFPGGIVTLAGLAAAVVFSERSKAGIIAGVVLMLAGLVSLLFGSIESRSGRIMAAETAKAEEEARSAAARAEELNGRLERIRAGISQIKEKLQQAAMDVKTAESAVKETTVERNGILERKQELEADYEQISQNAENDRRTVFAELENADRELAGELRTKSDAAAYLEELCGDADIKLRDFESKQKELDLAITEKQRELARIEGTLSRYGDIGERIDEASKHLEEVRTVKSGLNGELEAVKLASTHISEISDYLKGGFDRRINDLLGKACSLVTSGRYTKARITEDCEPEVMTDRGFIPVRYLSVGAAEQVFLAFRLAMSEFIFENDEIPLIFDEVFAYYDDTRLRSALEAISRLKDRQVFLFACSGRERRMLDELGVNYNPVRL